MLSGYNDLKFVTNDEYCNKRENTSSLKECSLDAWDATKMGDCAHDQISDGYQKFEPCIIVKINRVRC